MVGGSWGATLAVAYAENFNTKVDGMILRSLFLGTSKEIDWAFFHAPLAFRPYLIFKINNLLKIKKVTNPIYTSGKMLESKDDLTKIRAAKLWLAFESNLSTINFNYEFLKKLHIPKLVKK